MRILDLVVVCLKTTYLIDSSADFSGLVMFVVDLAVRITPLHSNGKCKSKHCASHERVVCKHI